MFYWFAQTNWYELPNKLIRVRMNMRYSIRNVVTINWAKVCFSKFEWGLQVINFLVENKTYLLKLFWKFAYSQKPWFVMMKVRFLISKYKKILIFRSSSIWSGIKDFYDVVLENTYWTVGSSANINFWNNL